MLLNSVIISINQFLPLALLWVLLHHSDFGQSGEKLPFLQTLITCALACAVFLGFADTISQWFDYKGLEMLKILFLLGIYGSVIAVFCSARRVYKQIAIVLASVMYLSHFVMYVSSYWQLDTKQGIMIGTILGLGICLSFCTLLFFTLSWFKAHGATAIVLALLSAHSASKVANAIDLAAQIDILPSSETVFDLRFWLDEYGITGRLLKALLGYEATPSYANLVAFTSALMIAAVVIIWRMRLDEQKVVKGGEHGL
ncbi:hypothetical protein HG263_08255 [Pseudoalteromonas sp. JBTF-M23]|uniref:High-affinity iron transporter n=1 Tax=Pseudoalteromonas caenipelagi TaxID=2726988 RepID=A0A849VAZ0_9GAMM|nr:hypothetical protein [Pseudoalteromonas caenipelagi]NOU50532.1 hypothetical protein [Pseudoalteromonas caenipelagi]